MTDDERRSVLARIAALTEAQRSALAVRLRAGNGESEDEGAGTSAHLVAYVVTRPGPHPHADDLRAFLLDRLPAPLVPSRVVLVDELLRLPSGKVDRAGLRRMARPSAAAPGAGWTARTPAEATIARVFGEVLGVEHVGPDDTFLSLGGQSVLASVIVERLGGLLGVRIPLRVLFEHPTVPGLAAWLEEGAAAPAVPAPRRGGPEPALSSAQWRSWFQQRLDPGDVAFNVLAAVRIRGAVDAASLERALGEIVRRHDVLRTVYPAPDGVPLPGVEPWSPVPLPIEELRGGGEAAAMDVVTREARRPFDLDRAPLLRATLIRLAPDDHVLAIVSHHIAADAWAFEVLFRELEALYGDLVAGREPSLPEPTLQYADYAAWEAAQARHELDAGLDHWRRRLAGAPAGRPLGDGAVPVPGAGGTGTGMHPVEIPDATAGALAGAAARLGTSVFVLTLAAFADALRRRSGRSDVVIATPMLVRGPAPLHGLIGCFVNAVVIRIDAGPEAGPRELVTRAHEAMLDAHTYASVPFESVVGAVRAAGHPDVGSLSRVVLNFTEALPAPRLAGARTDMLDTGPLSLAKNDLTLYLERGPGSLRGRIVYAERAFAASGVAALGDEFVAALTAIPGA